MKFSEAKRKWDSYQDGTYQASEFSDILSNYPRYDASQEEYMDRLVREGWIVKKGNITFHYFKDGIEKPLGMTKCFRKKDSLADLMNRAFRDLITDQVRCRVYILKDPRCFHCGERIFVSNRKSFEMHHTNVSFDNMVKDFISKNGMCDVNTIGKPIFKRISYSQLWLEYHRNNATLVPVHKKCHSEIDHTILNKYPNRVHEDDLSDLLNSI